MRAVAKRRVKLIQNRASASPKMPRTYGHSALGWRGTMEWSIARCISTEMLSVSVV